MTVSVQAAMAAFEPALPLGVAFSGGADSTALLFACAAKWPGQVVALHINHGLQAAAADFERQSEATCAQLQVELRLAQVQAGAAQGQSPEDAARRARYQALDRLAAEPGGAGPLPTIALAQHADDQVETVLLAWGRGAGLAGLSGMRASWQRGAVRYVRPWLGVSGADIRLALSGYGAAFVEDPSNTDVRFTRNRLRAQVLPALAAANPQFRDTFARSAAHAAQAVELLDALAADDLRNVARPTDGLPRIRALQALSHARQNNVLRYWLKTAFGVMPSTAQMAELQRQLAACVTRGHRLHLKVGAGLLERSGEVLAWYNPAAPTHS
jgi:tRNA(Ile)-lysidine synthase